MDFASIVATVLAQETPVAPLRSGPITTQLGFGKLKFSSGTGLNEVDKVFADSQSIAASGNKTYDLYAFGGAVDQLDAAYALTRIVAIMVVNTSTDPSAILTFAAGASDGFPGINGSGTGTYADIAPGGVYLIAAPTAAGMACSSTTGAIKFTNQSSTAAATFQIIVLGSQ